MRPESTCIAGPGDSGKRLDRIIRIVLPDLPLSGVYASIRSGAIRVNGRRVKPDLRIRTGDIISVRGMRGPDPGDASVAGDEVPAPAPDDRSVDALLLHSCEDLFFFSKPAGMLVHGPGSLAELVARRFAHLGGGSLSFRIAPLHRLDRNTSGVVAFPRSAEGARVFCAALRRRRVRKFYLALLQGELASRALWTDRLVRTGATRTTTLVRQDSPPAAIPEPEEGDHGRTAETIVVPLARSGGRTLACIEIRTGLTHQIRAQASIRGFPLVGDLKYGGGTTPYGYILHGWTLFFPERLFPDLPDAVLDIGQEPAAAARRAISWSCRPTIPSQVWAWP